MSSNALLWPSQGTIPEERLDKYKWLRLPSQGAKGAVEPPAAPNKILAIYPPIADVTFQFYKFYQIRKGQAEVPQTNMSLVILDQLGPGVIQQAQGFDIRVFDSDGIAIPYEKFILVILPDTSARVEIWLNMTLVKDFEFVQVTYGKPTATEGSNPNAVYDSNYKGVYHLNQFTFGVDSIIDSTSNGNDGTDSGTIAPVVGKIGQAIRFEPSSLIDLGSTIMDDMNDIGTISMWINFDDIPGGVQFRLPYSLRSGPNSWEVELNNSTDPPKLKLKHGVGGQALEFDMPSSLVDSGEFHYFTFVWNQPNSSVKIYIDGNLVAEQTTPFVLNSTTGTPMVLGNRLTNGASTSVEGIEDEVRLSNIERDADWIKIQFNNQNDNDAFWDKTALLTNGEDHFLIDDQGRFIVAVQP